LARPLSKEMKKTTLENFITDLATRIVKQNDWDERMRVNSSVILRKRLRDLTDDDRTGLFSGITGNWVSIDLAGIYSWNIIKPTVRANKASMITMRVKIDIEPRFQKDSIAEMASEVSRAVVEQKDRQQWTLLLEENIADESQIGAGVFVRTRWNPNLKSRNKVARWEEEKFIGGGLAVCGQCGAQFEPQGVDSQPEVETVETPESDDLAIEQQTVEQTGTVMCECGGQAQIIEEPQEQVYDILAGYDEVSLGRSETSVHQFWNFRIDERATQGGNIDAARWFEHHYLVGVDELEVEYPEASEAIRQTNENWSYPLRWEYALKVGRNVPQSYPYEMVEEQREVRDIYLTPAMYLNYEMEVDFELKGNDGKTRFKVKKGKTLADATFNGQDFPEPATWCFRVIGNHVLDVFPSDFKKEWSYITFLSNPSNYWGLFYTELISLQDIVNYMLTLQVYHIRRNAITSIVYNKGAFDPEDFEEDLIPTKEEFPYDFPINQQFGIVPPLTLSAEPMNMMQLIIQGKGDVTQVQPAMIGQAQPGEPYHAQLLQKQQSLGLLAPAGLSKASAKVRWAIQQLRLAQEHWTDEDTEEMLRLNPEWTEDFIDAFLQCDLEQDLVIDFQEGSEIPRSLIEREIQLRQFMTDVMALAQFNPTILTPETINDLLTRIAQSGGVEIDLNNAESDLRLAEARYTKIRGFIGQTKVPPVPELIMQLSLQITAQPDLTPLLFETHQTHIEFYSDKLRNESARDEPDYLLMGCLQTMIDLHQQKEVQAAQRQMQMQLAAQMPAMQMAQEQEQQQMAQEQEQGQIEAERGQAERQEQAQQQQTQAQAERDHTLLQRAIDMEESERGREHQTKLAKMSKGNKKK